MVAGKQEASALNNALWCDAVLKAAGARTGFSAGFWRADGLSLPLCPNIVTLSANQGAEFYSALKNLPQNSSVKDSFDNLDLAPFGFRKRQSGTWLFRHRSAARKPPINSGWHKITHSDGFKKWLACWNSNEKLHGVLSPELLQNRSLDFAALLTDGSIKAGAILNSGPVHDGKEILGLSNVFNRRNWLYSALRGLLGPFDHRPVCTCECDRALLPVYRQLGFEVCGQLSVWLKEPLED